jgi:hypothetical protein
VWEKVYKVCLNMNIILIVVVHLYLASYHDLNTEKVKRITVGIKPKLHFSKRLAVVSLPASVSS